MIVATGSTSLSLRISGLENNERVVLCEDFLERGRIEDAAEYIVVGGGAAGLETAEYIAEGGGAGYRHRDDRVPGEGTSRDAPSSYPEKTR